MKHLLKRGLSRRFSISKGLKGVRSDSTRTVSLEEEQRSEGRVRFSSNPPQVHASEHALEVEDQAKLWYRSSEITAFQQDSFDHVQQTNVKDNEGLLKDILAAHAACQTIRTRDDLEALLATIDTTKTTTCLDHTAAAVPTTIMGLEKWATPALQKAHGQQRRELSQTVRKLQKKKSTTTDAELRSACFRSSQPARLFAQYLGALWQQHERRQVSHDEA